jgi:hypothetical protein
VTLVPASQTRPAPEAEEKDPAISFPEYGEPSDIVKDDEAAKMFCHLMPDQCVEDTAVTVRLSL